MLIKKKNPSINIYYDDPDDSDDFFVESEHGFFPHWFHQETGKWNFTYQYPQIWFDLRDKWDRAGINYFQNSKNATLENRAYCIENPNNHKGYGTNVWGLTACECPLHDSNYGAHGPRQDDDGTIAPAGAGGSMIFTPRESIEALRYMKEAHGDLFWGKYGFKDAFNLETV